MSKLRVPGQEKVNIAPLAVGCGLGLMASLFLNFYCRTTTSSSYDEKERRLVCLNDVDDLPDNVRNGVERGGWFPSVVITTSSMISGASTSTTITL